MTSTCRVQYVLAATGVETTGSCLLILWEEDQIGHGQTRGQLSPGTSAAMALPVSWCTIWKGTPQDCVDNLHLAHAVPASVRTVNLGKWFPPWTVKCQTWSDPLNLHIFGVSTDVLLFSECGHLLVHHYCVFTKGISHVSRRGSFLEISEHSSRSPRLWAGGDRTRIWHSCHLYIEDWLPRGASSSGIRMKNHPAVWLGGCALLARYGCPGYSDVSNVCFISVSAFAL